MENHNYSKVLILSDLMLEFDTYKECKNKILDYTQAELTCDRFVHSNYVTVELQDKGELGNAFGSYDPRYKNIITSINTDFVFVLTDVNSSIVKITEDNNPNIAGKVFNLHKSKSAPYIENVINNYDYYVKVNDNITFWLTKRDWEFKIDGYKLDDEMNNLIISSKESKKERTLIIDSLGSKFVDSDSLNKNSRNIEDECINILRENIVKESKMKNIKMKKVVNTCEKKVITTNDLVLKNACDGSLKWVVEEWGHQLIEGIEAEKFIEMLEEEGRSSDASWIKEEFNVEIKDKNEIYYKDFLKFLEENKYKGVLILKEPNGIFCIVSRINISNFNGFIYTQWGDCTTRQYLSVSKFEQSLKDREGQFYWFETFNGFLEYFNLNNLIKSQDSKLQEVYDYLVEELQLDIIKRKIENEK